MRRPSLNFLAVVLALTLAVGGCAGGGEDSTEAALTKAEFIKQGDEICDQADEQQKADLKAYLKANPDAQSTPAKREKAIVAVALPPIQAEADELAALAAPQGDEAEVEAIVAGIQDALKKGEEEPAIFLSKPEGSFAEVDKLAREYGFKVCAKAL